MNDRDLMETLLQLEKGACDLFMHGTIESPTDSVHEVFGVALNDALQMQDAVYDKMAAKGWYPTEQAESTKINSLKQKYSGSQN